MSYEFKRLSDVEELAAAPKGAKALAVVDRVVKQVPVMFDLEVDMPTSGKLQFANNEQLQKAYDNNMSIYVEYYNLASGIRYVYRCLCPSIKDSLTVNTASGGAIVLASGLYSNHNTDTLFGLYVYFDPTKYAADETQEVTDGSYMTIPSGMTVMRVYASIF